MVVCEEVKDGRSPSERGSRGDIKEKPEKKLNEEIREKAAGQKKSLLYLETV